MSHLSKRPRVERAEYEMCKKGYSSLNITKQQHREVVVAGKEAES